MKGNTKDHQKAFSLRMTPQLHTLMLVNYKNWGYNSVNELIVYAINQLIEAKLMNLEINQLFNTSSSENAIELILDIKGNLEGIIDSVNELSSKSESNLNFIKSIVGFNAVTNIGYLDMKGGSLYIEKARSFARDINNEIEGETVVEQIEKVISAKM